MTVRIQIICDVFSCTSDAYISAAATVLLPPSSWPSGVAIRTMKTPLVWPLKEKGRLDSNQKPHLSCRGDSWTPRGLGEIHLILSCVCVCVCVRPCVCVLLGHNCVIKVNELKLDAQRCRSSRCAKRKLCIRTKRWYICLHFLVLFLFGFHKYSMLVVQVFREGNGNPLQYFCLENPMDGGAW